MLYSYITTTCGQTNSEPYFASGISPASGVILFEDAYENLPGQMVGRSSIFRAVSVSGTTGTNAANIEVQLVSGSERVKVHEGSYDGPIVTFPWSISVDKYKPIKKTFYVEALTASSSEDDICFKLIANDGDQEIVHEAKLTAIELFIYPEEEAAENKCEYRHTVGVGEILKMGQSPATPVVEWGAKGYGAEIIQLGNPIRCRAALNAGGARFSAKCKDAIYYPAISVIEPTGISGENPRAGDSTYVGIGDAGGAILLQDIYVLPKTVSFSALAIQETICTNEIPPTGYFANPQLPVSRSHTSVEGAGNGWHNVISFNKVDVEFDAAGFDCAWPRIDENGNIATNDYNCGWLDGTITWRIPLQWRRSSKTKTYSANDFPKEYTQEFMIDSNGKTGVRKFLNAVTRTTNDTVYVNFHCYKLNGEIQNEEN